MLDSNQHRRFWRPPCCQLHQCHIPDLVNVQVGKTFGMVEWFLPPTARSWSASTPFHRSSPSVISRLIKAGKLLSSTRLCRIIRAMPSVSRTATSVKPSTQGWSRTNDVRFRKPALYSTELQGCMSPFREDARNASSGLETFTSAVRYLPLLRGNGFL